MRGIRNVAVAIGVTCTTFAGHAIAQRTVTKPGETLTATATIEKIDAARRFVVLRDDDGSEVGVFAPPAFTRLNELRAGDRVTLTYYESVVFRVRPQAGKAGIREEVSVTESASALPGATYSYQATERVTVQAVDRDAPSVTVVTPDRRVVTRKVDDRTVLDGVKPGDRVDITYTQAVLATVAREK